MKLKDIKTNTTNPRVIKDAKFKKLMKSIQDFPKMMELRPLVLDSDNVVLGGNMRLKAIQELGMDEIPDSWTVKADELTDKEKKDFILKDNSSFGEWNWDVLSEFWDLEDLENAAIDFKSAKDVEYDMEEFADFDDDERIDVNFQINKVWFERVHKSVRTFFKDMEPDLEIDEVSMNFLVYAKAVYNIMKYRKVGSKMKKKYALYLPIDYKDLQKISEQSGGDILKYLQMKLYD